MKGLFVASAALLAAVARADVLPSCGNMSEESCCMYMHGTVGSDGKTLHDKLSLYDNTVTEIGSSTDTNTTMKIQGTGLADQLTIWVFPDSENYPSGFLSFACGEYAYGTFATDKAWCSKSTDSCGATIEVCTHPFVRKGPDAGMGANIIEVSTSPKVTAEATAAPASK